jgi:hypothetical protein
MKIKCDYCGNTYEDTLAKCPSCGGPNPSHKNDNRPKTIEELKTWYKERNLPAPEVTRFFIGTDYRQPKAFGIYKDDQGDFVVYKNKADGSRAVRYKGKDEAFAVNEIYERLKDEIVHQKNLNAGKDGGSDSGGSKNKNKNNSKGVLYKIVLLYVVVILAGSLVHTIPRLVNKRHNGYYKYNNTVYYNYSDNWYYYDDLGGDWWPVSRQDAAPVEINNNYDDYYMSGSWNSEIGGSDWKDTTYYQKAKGDERRSFFSSDSDYDWGGGDWDFGGTDWDSDW